MNRKILTAFIAAAALILSSCSEGIFNFSGETGNVSLTLDVLSTGGDDLQNVVFNLTNDETGVSVRKEASLSGGTSSADCYFYRINAGYWSMTATVYLSSGTPAAVLSDSFSLEHAQTRSAVLNYTSDGTNRNIDVSWQAAEEDDLEPFITVTSMDVIVSGYHTEQTSADTMDIYTTVRCVGLGFAGQLSGLELSYPDGSLFYYGPPTRQLTPISIDATSTQLLINRQNYSITGNFNLKLTDVNGVEVNSSTYNSLPFEPVGATAVITVAFGGGNTLLNTSYDKQDSSSVGTYIIYNVSKADGTLVCNGNNPSVYEDPGLAGDLTMANVPAATDAYIVLATVDADISQVEFDGVFVSGTTNLAPDKFSGWLYSQFPDRVNYVGLSVAEYSFP